MIPKMLEEHSVWKAVETFTIKVLTEKEVPERKGEMERGGRGEGEKGGKGYWRRGERGVVGLVGGEGGRGEGRDSCKAWSARWRDTFG